jgi:transposase
MMDMGADGGASAFEPRTEAAQIIAALRQENAALREENKALRTTIAQQQERIRELERRLGQNSRNSSRPPSSDPPWTPPAPAQKRSGRRPGGQRGHPGHHCARVPREQVDRVVDHWPKVCPHCQGTLTSAGEVGTPVPHQVHDVEYVHRVIQHDRHRVRCAHCGTTVLAELPPEVAGSQYGPGLAALVAVFSGVFQLARREVVHLCRELFAVPISGGSVQRLCQEASAAVAQPVAALAEAIRAEPVVGIDETGWRHRGKRGWLWAVWSRIGTLYRVADTRSGRIGREMLGPQYPGHVISDRFSGHNWIPDPRHQLCWSHLQRDAQAVIERGNPAARYGKALHGAALSIHRAWRSFKEAGETPAARLAMQQTLAPVQQRLRATLEQGRRGRSQNGQAVRLPVRQLAFAVGLPDGGRCGAHQQRHRARHAPSGPLAAQEPGDPERRGCPLRRTDAHSQCHCPPPGPFAPHLRAGCPGCGPPAAARPVAAAIRPPA